MLGRLLKKILKPHIEKKNYIRYKLLKKDARFPLSRSLGEVCATGLYSGYFPVASGTAGTAASLVFWPMIRKLKMPARILLVLALYFAGWKTGEDLEKELDKQDPASVVMDEFVGMYVTLLPDRDYDLADITFAFLAFRFFDIVKPWPAAGINDNKGGYAIMTDDVIAGFYAMLLTMLFRFVRKKIN
jgi:phosphatidylglycerophosphatase A